MFGFAQAIRAVFLRFSKAVYWNFAGLEYGQHAFSDFRLEWNHQYHQKAVTITLGFLSTVFVGLLSIKGLLAGAADSAVAKGAKF